MRPEGPSSGHKGLAYGVSLRFPDKSLGKILFGRTSAVAVLASFCGIGSPSCCTEDVEMRIWKLKIERNGDDKAKATVS